MAPVEMKVGFLGLGIMGEACARNLLKSGKFAEVMVWNRTLAKCDALKSEGATVGSTPAEVVAACDITFGMLSDPAAATEVALGPGGVAEGISGAKGYVDMSTVDAGTSQAVAAAITAKGGRFLEAPVSGSKGPAIEGTLILLTAGDKSLFDDATTAMDIMGKKSYFLGDVGAGAKMKLVVNMVMGSMMTAFCEGLALADKSDLSQSDLLEILDLGAMANGMFRLKGPAIMKGAYPPAFPLKHTQKDMRLAVALGDEVGQPLPVAAAANEQYKAAKSAGHGDEDFAAVYTAVKK